MLIKTRVYLIAFMMFVFSVVLLIFSIRNKNIANRKFLNIYAILTIFFLFIDLTVVLYTLKIYIGLEILYVYAMAFVAGILSIVTIIVNIVKSKKAIAEQIGDTVPADKNVLIAMAVLAFVLPIVLLASRVIRDRILIKNADLIVVFDSAGNGGIGDGDRFAYAIRGDSCKSFDLGIEFGLDKLVDKSAVEIRPEGDILELPPYKVVMGKDYIIVYNGEDEIYKYSVDKRGPHLRYYFNIDWDQCFYKE